MRLLVTLLCWAPFLAAQQPLVEGNAKSSVRVIIYEDLQCPDCATLRTMLDEKLLPAYRDKVAFEHRDFPLAKHNWARKAAATARYVQETNPELATEYRRYLMNHIKQTTLETFPARVMAFAKQHKLDGAKIVASADDPRLAELVEKDFQEGVARGVVKTPTAFVNGEPFVETFTLEQISQSIDKALAP